MLALFTSWTEMTTTLRAMYHISVISESMNDTLIMRQKKSSKYISYKKRTVKLVSHGSN